MSAIDVVLVVIALVAVGVAVACALQLKGLRAELRERGGNEAETLAALEQANSALDALNVTLTETRRTANAIAQQQTTDAAVEQQRYLTIAREFSQAGDRMDDLRRETTQQLGANREGIEQRLDKVRETVDAQLGAIRKDNNAQLDQMRATVDEKLSRTLNDRLSASFKQVSDQLEAVYKGLGDMQSIATGVGDLKRVLGNVKARGILGEVQLGAILADILTPDQYLENVATKPGASERVEFAVKLPVDEGDPVLLPIDSKFPGDAYEHLLDAQESGDAEAVAAARKTLDAMVKREAIKQTVSRFAGVRSRIIPAHAGQTRRIQGSSSTATDHPRACGANSQLGVPLPPVVGSSPRMRGKHPARKLASSNGRIIPAHAGQTLKHG